MDNCDDCLSLSVLIEIVYNIRNARTMGWKRDREKVECFGLEVSYAQTWSDNSQNFTAYAILIWNISQQYSRMNEDENRQFIVQFNYNVS